MKRAVLPGAPLGYAAGFGVALVARACRPAAVLRGQTVVEMLYIEDERVELTE